MFNRFKKAVVVLAALAILPAVANAQTSRIGGMAVPGDYVKDWSGIYTYVSEVGNVGNLVYGELGHVVSPGFTTPVDRGVGAVLGNLWDGRYGTWAIHMREVSPALGQGIRFSNFSDASSNPGQFGFDPNFNGTEAFDVQWGRKFGTTSFGVRLNKSYGQFEGDLFTLGGGATTNLEFDVDNAGDPNFFRNVFGLGAGVGFDMGPNSNLQVSGLWQSRTFEVSDSTGVTNYENDGSTTYQLAARWMWQWQPNVLVVPVIKIYNFDLSTKGALLTTETNTLSGWSAGLAGNWVLGSNDLFVLGATFASNKVEQESGIFDAGFGSGADPGTIQETIYPQVFAALETHVNNWLTLRFGANKGVFRAVEVDDSATPANYTVHNSPFSMALGAGVKVGNLQLDGVLNDNFAHNGLFFFSGVSQEAVASRITATYAF
ncbi:MAG: hypothetical protein HOP12_00050 [Candidatus Eisenbacteria bacterium]|uniref:Uncharacterized protein n=1 Tax=Eiseniibacteriota bacterium TaxID=2212470 RepID=A0A849SJ17_UNCEI|nr:hypothetical protein [Candidatus Eisenbacteria bacterium]